MSGWIKLHRSLFSHWIAADDEKLCAWLKILATVNHTAKKVAIGNRLLDCKPGEALLSLDSWCLKLGPKWNKSKVRRFFALLEGDGMIVTKNETQTTRLTLVNWGTYQDQRHADETQTTRKRHADDTQMTPTQEWKERKEGEEDTQPPPSESEESYRGAIGEDGKLTKTALGLTRAYPIRYPFKADEILIEDLIRVHGWDRVRSATEQATHESSEPIYSSAIQTTVTIGQDHD